MAKGSSSSSTLSVRESSSHAALEPVPDEGGSAASPSPSSSNAELLSVSFNQDYVCFACGTASGFRIYDCDPFRETFRRDFGKGVGMVEMLFRCNILALVGGGASPRYPPNKVMIWDDHQSRCIGELSFRSNVRAVRLRRDRIIVVLEHKIYVYNFADLKLLHQIDTIANPKGLCSLSPSSNAIVLACLGLHRGHVRVEHYGIKRTKFIPAHESDVAAFALTLDGRLLATASKKGTLIRVFNSLDGTRLQELSLNERSIIASDLDGRLLVTMSKEGMLIRVFNLLDGIRLQEVRRGADKAEIYSIAFSSNDQWLAVSSDRGTVHVFGLRTPASAEEPVSVVSSSSTGQEGYNLVLVDNGSNIPVATSSPLAFSGVNPGSTLSFMKGVLPRYFSSEWSFAQFRLPEDVQTLVAFSHRKNTVVIVGMNGSYYKCTFDPDNGGPMKKLEDTTILKPDSASEAV